MEKAGETTVISIHAPTRGATLLSLQFLLTFCISIHAPTRGATKSNLHIDKRWKFQSTLPQGERPNDDRRLHEIINFNPRSHKGSDCHVITEFFPVFVISIHAPTRGATFWRPCAFIPGGISIHAPTRGATAIFPNFRPCITLNIPKFYQYHSFFLIICS